jgi:hypothetical protein
LVLKLSRNETFGKMVPCPTERQDITSTCSAVRFRVNSGHIGSG